KRFAVNDSQLLLLSGQGPRSPACATLSGNLYKRGASDTGQMAACAILCFYQNLLFYYRQRQVRQDLLAWLLLEGSYCDKQTALKLPGAARDAAAGQQQWTLISEAALVATEMMNMMTVMHINLSAARAGLQAESAARVQHFLQERRATALRPPSRDRRGLRGLGVEAIKIQATAGCKASRRSSNRRICTWLQIMESERLSKWHYVKQTEELMAEVAQLRKEVRELKELQHKETALSRTNSEETEELRKIK
uniref:Dynactin domain-containing protein n=1 Tax=Macrostomum lignano TaxID=282301 RepID=A0A1I8FDM3_9PLAT